MDKKNDPTDATINTIHLSKPRPFSNSKHFLFSDGHPFKLPFSTPKKGAIYWRLLQLCNQSKYRLVHLLEKYKGHELLDTSNYFSKEPNIYLNNSIFFKNIIDDIPMDILNGIMEKEESIYEKVLQKLEKIEKDNLYLSDFIDEKLTLFITLKDSKFYQVFNDFSKINITEEEFSKLGKRSKPFLLLHQSQFDLFKAFMLAEKISIDVKNLFLSYKVGFMSKNELKSIAWLLAKRD